MIRRVLLISAWYPSDDSDVSGVFVEDQARVLSDRFNVLVFVQRIFGWRQALKNRILPGAEFTSRNGVQVYEQRVVLPPKLPWRVAMAYQLTCAIRAMAVIGRKWAIPEIVHAHVVLPAGWIAARIGRKFSVPVILTEHTGPFSAHLTSPVHRSHVREALGSCAKIIVVSPSLVRQIGDVDPHIKVEVTGNVILTNLFVPATPGCTSGSQESPLRLLSVGLLNHGKGYEHLLRAAQLLMNEGFDCFELYIGGDGPDRPRLEALIGELGLKDRCWLLGMLTRRQVVEQMQKCDVFVHPSLAETFGVVIGEAMSCGKPVLATRCGGPDFLVTPETGILVRPGDASALAQGIKELAGTRAKYSSAGIRAHVMARFGESAFLEALTRIYSDVACAATA